MRWSRSHRSSAIGRYGSCNLCEKCAAERGIETHVTMPKQPLADFLQAVQQKQLLAGSDELAVHVLLTSTLRDFRNTGRLGCAHCYGAFEAKLRDLLRRVHGTSKHHGQALPSAGAGHGGGRLGGDRAARRGCGARSSRSSSRTRRSCATSSRCWSDARSVAAARWRRELARRLGRPLRHRAVHADAPGAEPGGLRLSRARARRRAAPGSGAGARSRRAARHTCGATSSSGSTSSARTTACCCTSATS